jgi:hypothetical protein
MSVILASHAYLNPAGQAFFYSKDFSKHIATYHVIKQAFFYSKKESVHHG